jgi:hypothetical protein
LPAQLQSTLVPSLGSSTAGELHAPCPLHAAQACPLHAWLPSQPVAWSQRSPLQPPVQLQWSAYSFSSFEPTYTVPSAPTAGELWTSPPVV